MSQVSKDEIFHNGSFVYKTKFHDQLEGVVLNQDDVDFIEGSCTAIRSATLDESTAGLGFGIERLKAIHQHLFQDVYDWAGKTRDFEARKLSNGNATFASPDQFESIFEELELDLMQSEWFDDAHKVDRDEFVNKISDVYTQVNNAHIFPDGNGRASREYISALAQEVGFFLDHSKVNKKDWHQASKASFEGNKSQMKSLFDKMATENPLNIEQKNEAKGVIKGLRGLQRLGLKLDESESPESLSKNNSDSEIVKKNERKQGFAYPSL